MQDHPRLRGEKTPLLCLAFRMLGSPPLTRGKVIDFLNRFLQLRITPAYAGKRNGWNPRYADGWDHPRLRGEKYSGKSRHGAPVLNIHSMPLNSLRLSAWGLPVRLALFPR